MARVMLNKVLSICVRVALHMHAYKKLHALSLKIKLVSLKV